MAPLMVVKGDGSLVPAAWAMERPVETVLSGPAASVVGAWHLAGRRDVWTVDVGGTTTDIAALNDGRPRRNARGAHVGGWRTMVEAADVHTIGLGGDSHVRVDGGGLMIGPRRVIPLCLLAAEYPQVIDVLRSEQWDKLDGLAGQFMLAQRPNVKGLAPDKRALLSSLTDGPRSLTAVMKAAPLAGHWLRGLEAQQVVLRSAFTPTDALHALGRLDLWNSEASCAGAAMLGKQMDVDSSELCEQVIDQVSDGVSQALVTKILGDEADFPDWEEEPAAQELLARALGGRADSDLGCQIQLRRPLVAIGAPVEAYLPRVANQLKTELIIPPHAGVANAVGAVMGSVVQQIRVAIQPLDGQGFRLHLPNRVVDFATLAESVRYAEKSMTDSVEALARDAGATHVEVRVQREDRTVPVRGDRIYLGTELTFTAAGRPALAT